MAEVAQIIPERIPLNFFRRVKEYATRDLKSVYTTPGKRAAVIISALATNLADVPRTVSAYLSTAVEIDDGPDAGRLHTIISNFEIPPNDAVNLVINKFVITEGDDFIVQSNADSSVNITLAILESYNVP
jgi:hypothetical protein